MYSNIAIATMVGQNQGNRLQNYALQKILVDLTGSNVETLQPAYSPSIERRLVKKALRCFLPKKRWARFEAFDNRYIKFSRNRMDDPLLNETKFDLFVIGSDQVWNPTFDLNGDNEYLPQVSKQKKCSYAASFGVEAIRSNREHIAALLSDIELISVREDAGADIVEDLIGFRPPVVLDPTMLLSADQWNQVARRPKMAVPVRGYILKYVLGENVSDSNALIAAGETDCPIIDLQDRSLPVGPAEFVWLIAHARYVCTDSFHASVFSTLFHTPFAIFERVSANEDMSSRFKTFCDSFGLDDRRIRNGANTSVCVSWATVDSRLVERRKKSMAFLERCVNDFK